MTIIPIPGLHYFQLLQHQHLMLISQISFSGAPFSNRLVHFKWYLFSLVFSKGQCSSQCVASDFVRQECRIATSQAKFSNRLHMPVHCKWVETNPNGFLWDTLHTHVQTTPSTAITSHNDNNKSPKSLKGCLYKCFLFQHACILPLQNPSLWP